MRRSYLPREIATRLIASSVIRGAQLNESHGGLCLIDFATGKIEYLLDWNTTAIDVAGRGGDRGLRGIAIAGDDVYVASSQALLRFDRDVNLKRSFTNRYLRHCHEVSIHGRNAYVVSTGFDSILVFNLDAEEFRLGFHLRFEAAGIRLLAFDPRGSRGPQPSNVFHLNSVRCESSGLYFAGLRTAGLLCVKEGHLSRSANLPLGTHNAQPFCDGAIYNDTANNRLCARFEGREVTIPLQAAPEAVAQWVKAADATIARPLFARGLCPLSSRIVAGGQSPSTVTLYDLEGSTILAQAALSHDVRNAIHGLAVWPFPT